MKPRTWKQEISQRENMLRNVLSDMARSIGIRLCEELMELHKANGLSYNRLQELREHIESISIHAKTCIQLQGIAQSVRMGETKNET